MITVEPTSLTDVVVLSLWHRRRKGGIAERRPALVGETRVPVLEVHRSANMRREKPAGAEGSGGSEGGGGAGPAEGSLGATTPQACSTRASSRSSSPPPPASAPPVAAPHMRARLGQDLEMSEAAEAAEEVEEAAVEAAEEEVEGEAEEQQQVATAAAPMPRGVITTGRMPRGLRLYTSPHRELRTS